MASWQKRGKNSFYLVIETGSAADGTRRKETRTVKVEDTKLVRSPKKLNEHLNEELLKFKMEIESTTYVKPAKMTFETFTNNEWMPKYMHKRMSPLTAQNYTHHLKYHLFPEFGHLPLHDIKTMHIVTYFDDLDKTELSGSTKLYIFKVLKSVLNRAFKWKILSRNPIDGVEAPKIEKKQARYYDEVEAEKVIAALLLEPIKWKLFFLAAMLGGFRRGELVALEWSDVDWVENTFAICKSISLTLNGQAQEKAPKTEGSERIVDMPEWFMKEFKKYESFWREEQDLMGDLWEGEERQYVFHRGNGIPLYHNTPSMTWRRFLKRHSLPTAPLHSLRHTAATLLIEMGTDLKTIQERLGHTKHSTTADLYAHVTKKVRKETSSKLDKFNPEIKSVIHNP